MGNHGTGPINILEARKKTGVDWTPWQYIAKSPNRHYTDSKKNFGENNYSDLITLASDIIKIHDKDEPVNIDSRLNVYQHELVINNSKKVFQIKELDTDKLATIGELVSGTRKNKLEEGLV